MRALTVKPPTARLPDLSLLLRANVFVGSRACAANNYVIVEKCGDVCPHLRRASS